jgi:2-methylcitrate dehydratase PrpD
MKRSIEMATLIEKLSDFVLLTTYEDISEEARHRAKQCILDTLGVTLAGSKDPIHKPVIEYLKEIGGKKQSTVIGFGMKTSVPHAAFANGIFGHVLDYDDYTFSFIGHATVVIVPVILALGELLKSSGKDLLTAFLIGTEVQWKVGEALVSYGNHYDKGWHSSGTVGTLGAAAAAGKLLRLDSEKMAHAFSIAASEASGMREQFGTMTKSFHIGRAADNGITAAFLARGGFTGARTALEGDTGLFRLMADQYDVDKIKEFGNPWGILDPDSKRGVIFKLYPCCGSGDGANDGIFSLIDEHDIRPEEVESVECFAHEKKFKNLRHHHPRTGLEAKFSLEYWMAAALLERNLGLEQFTDEKVQRPELQEFMKKVIFSGLPEMPDRYPVKIKVNLKNGASYVRTYWPPKASPGNPPSDEELIGKYIDCSKGYGLPQDKIEKSIETIMRLEELGDANRLLALMYK